MHKDFQTKTGGGDLTEASPPGEPVAWGIGGGQNGEGLKIPSCQGRAPEAGAQPEGMLVAVVPGEGGEGSGKEDCVNWGLCYEEPLRGCCCQYRGDSGMERLLCV